MDFQQIQIQRKDILQCQNQFFSHKLSHSLNQVLIKAKQEEDFSTEQGLKMLEDLKGIHYFSLSRNKIIIMSYLMQIQIFLNITAITLSQQNQ